MSNDDRQTITHANTAQRIARFALPRLGDKAPGPLHTIVMDSTGNIYYSDEVNHSVVSLKSDGSLRWHKMKKGTASGELWYPRGLSIGYLQLHEEFVCCLAVGDAWNRRIQFLDLEGNLLGVWTHAGETAFGEIADVRFIRQSMDSKSGDAIEGCWYVLDRGNHRLCRFGIDGLILGEIGRGFPRSMENRWAALELFFGETADLAKNINRIPPFDFTFYPDRILGYAEDSLYIGEANSRRLKIVTPTHLLPAFGDTNGILEGIEADKESVLAWDRAGHKLIRLRNSISEHEEVQIGGAPVSSDLPTHKFWIQTAESIELWKWDFPAVCPEHPKAETGSWTLQAADAEIRRLDLSEARKWVQAYLAEVDRELDLAGNIAATDKADTVVQSVEKLMERMYGFTIHCNSTIENLRNVLHHFCLGQLIYLLAKSPRRDCTANDKRLKNIQNDLRAQIQSRLMDIQRCLDDLDSRLSQPLANDCGSTLRESWLNTVGLSKEALTFAGELIIRQMGVQLQ